jgi:hypothetical protein
MLTRQPLAARSPIRLCAFHLINRQWPAQVFPAEPIKVLRLVVKTAIRAQHTEAILKGLRGNCELDRRDLIGAGAFRAELYAPLVWHLLIATYVLHAISRQKAKCVSFVSSLWQPNSSSPAPDSSSRPPSCSPRLRSQHRCQETRSDSLGPSPAPRYVRSAAPFTAQAFYRRCFHTFSRTAPCPGIVTV